MLSKLAVAFRKTRSLFAFFLSNNGFRARKAEHSFVFTRREVVRVDERTTQNTEQERVEMLYHPPISEANPPKFTGENE